MSRLLLVMAAGVGLTACTSGGPPDTQRTHNILAVEDINGLHVRFDFDAETGASLDSIPAPPADVWHALAQGYAQLGLGTTANAGTRILQSQTRARRTLRGVPLARYFDCGSQMGIPRADNYSLSITAVSRVDSVAPAKSLVRTRVMATGHDPGTPSNEVQCSSRGRLEKEIARTVDEAVG